VTTGTRSSATAESTARPILVPLESSLCDFLSVINTNSPPILHSSQVMADYWSNFRQRHGSLHFSAPAGGDPLRISG